MRKSRAVHLDTVAPDESRPFLEIIGAGEPAATLIVPADGSLDGEARRIVQTVRERGKVELPVVTGDRALRGLPTRHAIALGCLADNPFVEALYFRWKTLVDRWYPGVGGWVLQSIASPFRPGNHVLLVGGSDPQGVRVATGRLIEQLRTGVEEQIPWQFEVQLGDEHLPLPEDRMDILGTAASQILEPESALPDQPYESGFPGGSVRDHLLRLGMYGPHADNYHLSRSSQLGLRALYTGNLEDAERYRRTLLTEVRAGVIQKLYHYKSLRMFQLWSLLEGLPVFFDADREEVTRAIRLYLLEESGVASIKALREGSIRSEIFSRHVACDALNLWVGADWLWRTTGESDWLEKRSVADAYLEAQAGTDVPYTGLTEGYASYLEAYLEWMLLSCPDRIREDRNIRLWADRVTGLCTNTGQLVLGPQTDESRYPYNLMRKLAYLLGDGRYLFVADLRERQVHRGMDRVLQFSAGQAFAGDVKAREPDGTGLITTPMNERLRQWKAPSIKPGKGFDRAVARSGWGVNDDYLMIVGVRGGGKSLPNVGSLAAYERFGQRLVTSDSVSLYPRSASPWRHSIVCVNAGGLGAGMAQGAEMLARGKFAGGHLLSYQMDTPDLCHWVRLLFWKPSAYVLVIDRVVADHDGTLTLGVNWRCAGQVETLDDSLATLGLESGVDGRFYVQVSEGLDLTTETNTTPAVGAPPGTPPTKEVMLHATVDRYGRDGEVEVATLLHAAKDNDGPRYQLNGCAGGWIVEGPDETLGFRKGARNGELEIGIPPPAGRADVLRAAKPADSLARDVDRGDLLPTRWSFDLPGQVSTWAQAADGVAVALGTEQGDVVVLNAEGNARWTATCDATVTALAFFEGDLIVGTRSGQVCRLDKNGTRLWLYVCQFRSERSFWPWWFLDTPAVAAIAAGHDPTNARDLVAVGTGSTNLIFLEAGTGSLIEDVLSRYGLPDRIRAHISESSGTLEFLVGHSKLTCGSTVRAWTPPPRAQERVRFERSVNPMGRSMDGWDTCGVVDFRVGPLAHGTPDRMIVLRHGAVNQITVYEEATGEPLWDTTLGGAPVALVVIPGETAAAARCYVAEQFGWLVGFDGTGKRVTATHLARSLQGMHAGPTGGLALWNSDQLHIIGEDQSTERFTLEGKPLGWIEHPQFPGLLCVDQEQLKMKSLR